MGTTERKPSTGGYIPFALSIGAAVLLWVVYIASPDLGVPVDGTFIASLILLTLNALFYIVFTPARFSPFYAWADWCDRRTDRLAYEAGVQAYRALDVAPYDDHRADLEDHVRHVRTAVCVINSWDPTTEADSGGKADRRILAYWAQRYPKDYALRDPQS